MKLTPEQLTDWWVITKRFMDKNPGFCVQRSAPMTKSDIRGLKQAINDTLVSYSGDFELDRMLVAAGLPNFDQMEEALRGKEKAILRRGKIRDEEELYIVKELLSEADSDLSPKQIAKLGAMMEKYEKRDA